VILGEQIAARALDEEYLDLLALVLFPVERALRMRRELARSRDGAVALSPACNRRRRWLPGRSERS